MDLELDAYAYLDSPLHRWDARYKLVGLMSLIFAFSYVRDLRLLPAMLLATTVLYAASGLPPAWLLARLRYPGAFLLIVAVLLPFLSGSTVLVQIGPLALRLEGCLELLRIVIRFVSILTLGLILFGTAPFLTAIKAMRALGLPPILADMTLLAYRYLFEIGGDLARMETAMRLRRRLIRFLQACQETLLVASHDLELILEVCDRVFLMDGGRIVAQGDPPAVMGDGELMAAHGMERPHSLTPHARADHDHWDVQAAPVEPGAGMEA